MNDYELVAAGLISLKARRACSTELLIRRERDFVLESVLQGIGRRRGTFARDAEFSLVGGECGELY